MTSQPATDRRPVIRLFNVKFSPNLGDGLLSECLERALIALGADPDSRSIDLAAREAYGDAMKGRALIMSGLDVLPSSIRSRVIRIPMAVSGARRWRPHYAASLRGADCVVVGGGNLISDIDLNFPTKLMLAMSEADRLGLPVAVYAPGVTGHWSKRGAALLARAFERPIVKGVFVRDEASRQNWDAQLGGITGHLAQVVRDPGLLAAECYPVERAPRERPVAGLGIMSHIAIRYHADIAPPGRDALDQWYLDVAAALIRQGFRVSAFTNGSPEDRILLEKLRPALAALGDDNMSIVDQVTPRDLCRNIADCDVIIAYRMHAIIAAYSYGVPAIGLAWDSKLQAFMRSVGREDYLRNVTEISPDTCAVLAAEAARQGIDESARRRVVDEARDDVRKLYDLLGRSIE